MEANKKSKGKKKKSKAKNKKVNKVQEEKELITKGLTDINAGVNANTSVYTPQKALKFEISGTSDDSSFQPTSFAESVTETSADGGLTDHNVAYSPSLELLNPGVVDLIRSVEATPRLGTELSYELYRLRNSIKLLERPVVLPLRRPIVLSLEAMENVKNKLRRTYDEQSIAILENIRHHLHAKGEEENDYSEDFAYWFFIHLHKIANYGKREEILCFDSDYGLFCAPNIVCNRRPDFAMMFSAGFIDNKPKALIACIGEGAKEGFAGLIHKDQEKLIKCMRVCIDDQLNHVPVTDCCVIGILHGETQLKIYEMQPVLYGKSKILVYDVYPLHAGILELQTAQGLSTFYIILQRVEALVKILKKKFQATVHKNFSKPPRDQFIDRSLSHHGKESQNKKSDDKKDKKDKKSNDKTKENKDEAKDSDEPPQDLEQKLQLALNGALTDIANDPERILMEARFGKLTVDGHMHEVALVQKLGYPDELEFLSRFDHPNIVKMLGCYSEPYKDEAAYILALERLQCIRTTSGNLRALHIARDICAGLVYLHSRNIIHRDINPRNIMQDSTGRVKIIDFNLATELQPGATCFDEGVGTGGFIAPEVDRVTSHGYDCKADVYSLGQTMRLLYTRKESHSSPIHKLINLCSLPMWQRPSAKQLLERINRVIDKYNSEIDRQKNQTQSKTSAAQDLVQNENMELK